jgi:hypothetical protein
MAHYKEKLTANATEGKGGETASGSAWGCHCNQQKYKNLLNFPRRILTFIRVDFKDTVC